MKFDPSRFVKSVAGKAVLATGVVLLAFGSAAAAGFTDVPSLLPGSDSTPSLDQETKDDSSSTEVTDESSTEVESSEATDESSDDDSTEVESDDESSVDSSADHESSDDQSSDDESSDDSSTDEQNHGQIVSEFAHTTELEGCEKGQAISDLASSNAADHRQNRRTIGVIDAKRIARSVSGARTA